MDAGNDYTNSSRAQSLVIGRVESRLDRLVRLTSGQLVQATTCPCKVRQFMLMKHAGEEYQPVWWET